MSCHKNICDRVTYLDSKAHKPTHMRGDPLIHPGSPVRSGRAPLAGENSTNNPPVTTAYSEKKGDLLIR